MANYTTTDTELTSIANAIRIKGGTSASLTYPSGFISAINDIQTGGNIDDLITRRISGVYVNSTVGHVGQYAFHGCASLTEVTFPSCSVIREWAFAYCSRLTSANFESCKAIWERAFFSCSKLTNVSFPSCSSIGSSAFYSCSALTSVNFPNVSRIDQYAFGYCTHLTNVSFNNITSIGSYAFTNCVRLPSFTGNCTSIYNYAFYNCSALASVSIPYCYTIGQYAFAKCSSLEIVSCSYGGYSIGLSAFTGCSSLKKAVFNYCQRISGNAFQSCPSLSVAKFPICTSIYATAFAGCYSLNTVFLPLCQNIGAYTFSQCSNLTTMSLPALTSLGASAFASCWRLLSLYLLSTSLPQSIGVNAFISTPISGYTTYTNGQYGSIYVRLSMLDTWKTATGWSAYSSRFVGVTDAELEELTTHTVVFDFSEGYDGEKDIDNTFIYNDTDNIADYIISGDTIKFKIPLNNITFTFDYNSIATATGTNLTDMAADIRNGNFYYSGYSVTLNGIYYTFEMSAWAYESDTGFQIVFLETLNRDGEECSPNLHWFFDDAGNGSLLPGDSIYEVYTETAEYGYPLFVYDAENEILLLMPVAENSGTYSGTVYVPDSRVAPSTGYVYTLDPYYDSIEGCTVMRIDYTTYT